MYDLTVNHNSKIVVSITPTDQDLPFTGDYEVALIRDNRGDRSPVDADFQEPDVDFNNSGCWIGPGTAREQIRGDEMQAWWRPSGATETAWTSVYPRVRIL